METVKADRALFFFRRASTGRGPSGLLLLHFVHAPRVRRQAPLPVPVRLLPVRHLARPAAIEGVLAAVAREVQGVAWYRALGRVAFGAVLLGVQGRAAAFFLLRLVTFLRPCSLGWDGAMRLVRRPVLLLALSAAVVAGFAARALAVLRRRLGAHGTKHGDDGVFEWLLGSNSVLKGTKYSSCILFFSIRSTGCDLQGGWRWRGC